MIDGNHCRFCLTEEDVHCSGGAVVRVELFRDASLAGIGACLKSLGLRGNVRGNRSILVAVNMDYLACIPFIYSIS